MYIVHHLTFQAWSSGLSELLINVILPTIRPDYLSMEIDQIRNRMMLQKRKEHCALVWLAQEEQDMLQGITLWPEFKGENSLLFYSWKEIARNGDWINSECFVVDTASDIEMCRAKCMYLYMNTKYHENKWRKAFCINFQRRHITKSNVYHIKMNRLTCCLSVHCI